MDSSPIAPTSPPRRPLRQRLRRGITWALAACGLGWLLVPWFVGMAADQAWEKARQKLTEIEAAQEQIDGVLANRPALHGESLPGRAFDHYDKAFAITSNLGGDHSALVSMWMGKEIAPGVAAAVEQRWAPAIAEMRRGAHRTDARRSIPEPTAQTPSTSLLNARWIVNLMMLEARDAVARGDHQEAVALTLDAATFGLDLCRSPTLIDQLIGVALVAIVMGDWTDARLVQLDSDALKVFSHGLRHLEAMMPRCCRLEGELLYIAAVAADPQLGGVGVPPSWRSARYWFSNHWMTGDGLSGYADLVSRRHDLLERVALEGIEPLTALEAQAVADPNPVLSVITPNFSSADKAMADALGDVRLLKMAVDVRRDLVMEVRQFPLADPITGKPFEVELEGNQLHMRGASRHVTRTVAVPR